MLYAQALGFAITIALVWIDEIADLPHLLLGAPATPANWRESLSETLLIGGLGVACTLALAGRLRRLRVLEGIVPMCFCCHKVRDEAGQWAPVEKYIAERSAASVSHGLCPECLRREYPDFADEVEQALGAGKR